MPCLEAHHSVGAGLCSAPTRCRKTVKFIKISAAPSIDGNRSTATSCKFGTPVSGGAYQDARKVALVWNDAQNIGSCLNSEAGRTKPRPSAPFLPLLFRQDGKEGAAGGASETTTTERILASKASYPLCSFLSKPQAKLAVWVLLQICNNLSGAARQLPWEEPFCGGMEPRGILRRLRRLRADWIFFLILRKAQNCGVDTPRNPVGRTPQGLSRPSDPHEKCHP